MDDSKHLFWQEILNEYSNSSQTVSDFCSDYGIPVWKFYYWRKRLTPVEPSFDEVSLKSETPPGSGIELSLGSLSIKLENGFNESTLRRVLTVLSC